MNYRGFTLIETLIAITILTLAVAGPLYTASRAIVAAQVAKDQLTASYLAQEGIEYMRQLRDTKYLIEYQANAQTASQVSWSDFGTAITSCLSPNACLLDTTKATLSAPISQTLTACSGSCTPSSPAHLYLTNYGSVYYYSQSQSTNNLGLSVPQTAFGRIIQVTPLPSSSNPTQYHITSRVNWNFHGSTYTVVVSDNLTPWQ